MRAIRRAMLAIACLAGLAAGDVRAAHAQESIPGMLLGGTAGVAAGGFITVTVIVTRARYGDYIYEFEELLGWTSTPVLLGGGVGAAVGLWMPDRLLRGVIGGTAGTLLGAGSGYLLANHRAVDREGRWAGAAIGAGTGLVIGALTGLLWPAGEDDDAVPEPAVIPIGVRLRF